MRVLSFAQNHYLSYLSSLCERDILVCELCSQTSAIYLLRKCDIISRCEIAIYLQREIYFVLQMWWKLQKVSNSQEKESIIFGYCFFKPCNQYVKFLWLIIFYLLNNCECLLFCVIVHTVRIKFLRSIGKIRFF